MQILSIPIAALNVCESLKFSSPKGNRGRWTRWWLRFYTGSGNMAVSCMRHTSGDNYSTATVRLL